MTQTYCPAYNAFNHPCPLRRECAHYNLILDAASRHEARALRMTGMALQVKFKTVKDITSCLDFKKEDEKA
jgi:hypothetical protein